MFVEYGDYSYEFVLFMICYVNDFVKVKGGEDVVLVVDLVLFNLFNVVDVVRVEIVFYESLVNVKVVVGDFVVMFGEIVVVWGCFGWFIGSEMMGVIKYYMVINVVFV